MKRTTKRTTKRTAKRAAYRGFTLVEVLVALVIVGVALAAGLRATAAMTRNAEALRFKLYATWSAENRLTELRAAIGFPDIGRREYACPQGSVPLVCEERIESTANPNMRRAEVHVFADASRTWPLVTLATVLPNAR
jgi:general secretion pathway protein I